MTTPRARARLCLRVLNECARYPAPRERLRRVLETVWRERGRGRVTLNLVLAGDRQVRLLQQRHKGCRDSTDVLAFADGEMDTTTRCRHLGDIVVNVDCARREARERGLRVRDEVTLYALHGLLHLLGMRDDSRAGRRAMSRVQAETFQRLGLPYAMDLM